jgi:hypothetical protein
MPRGDHYDERMRDPSRVRLLEHADLLLRLRREPELVRAVVQRLKLTAPPSDVAIHVDAQGPTGVFSLSGAPITCLAEGYAISDAHIVPHTVLLSVVGERDDLAARRTAAQQLTGEESPARALFERVVYAGRDVSREDFYAFAWFAPILGSVLFTLYRQGLTRNQFSVLGLRYRRQAKRRTPKLLEGYEEHFFRLGTLAMTVALSGRRLIGAGRLTAEDAYEYLITELMALGTLGAAVRSAWVAAKLGPAIVQTVKKRYRSAETGTDFVYAVGPLLAIAARHQNLRSEIRDVLRTVPPRLAPADTADCRGIHENVLRIAQQLAPKAQTDFQLLRDLGLEQYRGLTAELPSESRHRINDPEQLPAELACAVVADSVEPLSQDPNFLKYLYVAPLVALLEPESFFLPRQLLTELGRQWTADDSIRLARAQTNCRDPVRVGPKLGRNDPCRCGSGKKFKHCCG